MSRISLMNRGAKEAMSGVSITSPDVTLVLDTNGVIRDATLSNGIAGEGVEAWFGRPWEETVAGPTGDGVRRIVEDARTSGISAFRHVLQRFPSGLELPIEYTTIKTTGNNPGLLAMGKNLRVVAELQSRLAAAQQATEREYWKLREVETRCRLLFDATNDAVLMVGADDFRILEANPAAVRALGLAPGWNFIAELLPQERGSFRASLARVREQGRAPGIIVHIGAARETWAVRPSLMGADSGLRYLLNLTPIGGTHAAPSHADPASTDQLVRRLPDAFVVIDRAGIVLRANRAFLDLVQAGAEGEAIGESLGRWLCQPGADAAALLGQMQRHRTIRLLPTTIHGELGAETEIEISAASSADTDPQCYALLLRDVGRRLPGAPAAESSAILALSSLAEKLGKVSLLELVRIATDAVERQCIAAALQRAEGNRTAAAELLGVSRQSLHTKLNRYGFDGAGTGKPHQSDV